MPPLETATDAWKTLPEGIRARLAAELQQGETVIGCFWPDLDRQLRFRQGLVVMTGRRVLSLDDTARDDAWQSWPFAKGVDSVESTRRRWARWSWSGREAGWCTGDLRRRRPTPGGCWALPRSAVRAPGGGAGKP